MTHIWSPTLFPRGIIIFQGVLTKFFDEISTSGKFADLMKDLKYEHQSIFPCGGGSNLILGTDTKNQIFVYQMGRLCGEAHEISGIKVPHFLHGWVFEGFFGWVDGWMVVVG